jgi:hypothetical protein
MSTKKVQIKRLEPNSKKSQTLQAAYMVSHEIVMGILAQHLIPSKVEPLGLEDQMGHNSSAKKRITQTETTRILSIALDQLDLAHQRIAAYESALAKIKSQMDALHNIIEKPEVAGRTTNSSLRKDAEDVALEYFKKYKKFIKDEKLSNDVSKKVFDRDPSKYLDLWKEKFRKENPNVEFPAGYENSTSWPRFADHYRVLTRRTAYDWLKEIYSEFKIKK